VFRDPVCESLFAQTTLNHGKVPRTIQNSFTEDDHVDVIVHHKVTVVYSSQLIDGVATFGTLAVSTEVKFHVVVPVIPVNALFALSTNAQLSI
jgi:hypothetical protein